jgi:hypothetical protein
MKWVIAWLLGVLLGVVAAAGFIYVNPLTASDSADFAGTAALRYELGPDSLSFTHGGESRAFMTPNAVPKLWESAIERTAIGMFTMRDRAGRAVAIASRMSRLSGRTNALTEGFVVADTWLVTVPGAGSYVIEAQDNLWPLLRATVVDVGVLRRPWSGTRRYATTIGPNSSGAAVVIGATGRFADVRGSAANAYELDRFSSMRDVGTALRGELSLDIGRSRSEDGATIENP